MDESVATVEENTVISNTAPVGAGLVTYFSSATLNRNNVYANTASWYGGGLLLIGYEPVTLTNNIVMTNTADFGGGLLIANESLLINTIVADNEAYTDGSGIYILGSSPQLFHTTLARNGNNQGIYVSDNSLVSLVNTILVSHTVGITVTTGSTVTLTNTLWYSNDEDWSGAGLIQTNNDYNGDPAFVDPDNGDYHLDPTSAALNRGIPTDVTTDIDGDLRSLGGAPDLGADEFLAAELELTPELSISKRGPAVAETGQQITYTLTITNSGNITATELVITDAVPIGAYYIEGGAQVGNVVSWAVPLLMPNGGVTETTFVVTATQTITNSNYRVQAEDGYSATGKITVTTYVGFVIPPDGGVVTPTPGLTIVVGPAAFSETVVINYTDQPVLPADPLKHVGLFFELSAVFASSGLPAQPQPGHPYTIVVSYRQEDVPDDIDETDLVLYSWSNGEWVKEATSVVDVEANTITATPNHFSFWAALAPAAGQGGSDKATFLPVIMKN